MWLEWNKHKIKFILEITFVPSQELTAPDKIKSVFIYHKVTFPGLYQVVLNKARFDWNLKKKKHE